MCELLPFILFPPPRLVLHFGFVCVYICVSKGIRISGSFVRKGERSDSLELRTHGQPHRQSSQL